MSKKKIQKSLLKALSSAERLYDTRRLYNELLSLKIESLKLKSEIFCNNETSFYLKGEIEEIEKLLSRHGYGNDLGTIIERLKIVLDQLSNLMDAQSDFNSEIERL